MTDLSEIKSEYSVDGRKFVLIKDLEYGFWSIQSLNGHIFEGTYTTKDAAKMGCHKLSDTRPPVRYKNVKGK